MAATRSILIGVKNSIRTAVLTYVSNGDSNGVFYFIGTAYLSLAWTNPQSLGSNPVIATPSNTIASSDPIAALTDRAASTVYMNPTVGSYYKFDLGAGRALIVNAYLHRTRNVFDGDHPTAWTIEGSNDNSNWTLIDTQSGMTITGLSTWTLKTVVGQTIGYRYLRWTQTALNSSGNNYFTPGEMEFYGTLQYI